MPELFSYTLERKKPHGYSVQPIYDDSVIDKKGKKQSVLIKTKKIYSFYSQSIQNYVRIVDESNSDLMERAIASKQFIQLREIGDESVKIDGTYVHGIHFHNGYKKDVPFALYINDERFT
jgi:hypothetical protein